MNIGNWHLSRGTSAASGSAVQAQDQPLFSAARAHTSAEGAKNGYIVLVAAVVPFVLAVILGLGVGYFLPDFRGLRGACQA